MESPVNEMKVVADGDENQGSEVRITEKDLVDSDLELSDEESSDMVDEALDGVIQSLADAGYEDDSSVEATFDALEALMDSEEVTELPDIDASGEEKVIWVNNSIPKIKEKLKAMGLEF